MNMRIDVLAEKLGWKLLTESGGADREALGCYCGDLLSWVMGRAKADDVWLTVMGNINAIAVATLADVSAIVLVEDAVLDEEARARANQRLRCMRRRCPPTRRRCKSRRRSRSDGDAALPVRPAHALVPLALRG